MDRIHTSERRAFRRCRKKWEYAYLRGLEPKITQPKLWLGTIVHHALATFYGGEVVGDRVKLAQQDVEAQIQLELHRVKYNKLDEVQRQAIKDDAELARGLIAHYCDEHREDDIEVDRVEVYAEVPLNRATRVALRLDGICHDSNGEAWGLEHKTTAYIDQDAGYLELDEQATTYAWAMAQLSIGNGYILSPKARKLIPITSAPLTFPPIRGMLYNFLGKQVPHDPVINKDGSPSVASTNLTCKVSDYEEALRKAFPSIDLPEKYENFLAKLRTKKWFHRIKVYRGQDELAGFAERIWAEIKDMRLVRNHLERAYRNPTRDCLWDCPFFALCKGELEGLDMAFFQEENFTAERQLEMGV
jgi:hypothetical protein